MDPGDPRVRANEQSSIARAQAGNTEGIQYLYRKYKDLVYYRCLGLTRNPDLAEELTQEVFLQVCRKISTFRGAADIRTWLYRIATNSVLLHFRRNKRLILSLDEPISDEDDATLADRLVAPSMNLEEHVGLSEALASLTPRRRQILFLHDLDGYHHWEIARILGLRSGTSKSQLHRARVKLRTMCGFYHGRKPDGSLSESVQSVL